MMGGDYCTYRSNRQLLLDCRGGKHTFQEALELIEECDNQLRYSYERSKLPSKPDYNKINQLLIEINREGLSI